jgi:hypothetical protein
MLMNFLQGRKAVLNAPTSVTLADTATAPRWTRPCGGGSWVFYGSTISGRDESRRCWL